MNDIRTNILSGTKQQLRQCKDILQGLPPQFFTGVGLQFVSLLARQILLETIQTGDNPLGWLGNLEDSSWILKHQREVEAIFNYSLCVNNLRERGAPIDVIIQHCNPQNPEAQAGVSLLISEGMRKLFQWMASGGI